MDNKIYLKFGFNVRFATEYEKLDGCIEAEHPFYGFLKELKGKYDEFFDECMRYREEDKHSRTAKEPYSDVMVSIDIDRCLFDRLEELKGIIPEYIYGKLCFAKNHYLICTSSKKQGDYNMLRMLDDGELLIEFEEIAYTLHADIMKSDFLFSWIDAAITGLNKREPFIIKAAGEGIRYIIVISFYNLHIIHEPHRSYRNNDRIFNEYARISMIDFCKMLHADLSSDVEGWIEFSCRKSSCTDETKKEKCKELQDKLNELSAAIEQSGWLMPSKRHAVV